ncbi:MAG: hypothetical protein GWM88_14070 [Pseudomonadales bacterium]|nr:hypothetical protein [Pseudomonadales bacterium]NIX09067.1 hypothetical protein [Pseudomonadales bacterium]
MIAIRTPGFARWTLLGIVFVLAAAVATYAFYCPCEQVPGVYLLGDEVAEPVTDWAFVNDVRLCQVQVADGFLPHAINLNCMSSAGSAYLSCSYCAGKRWSNAAVDDPSVRLRVGGNVYPVRLERLTEPARLDAAWQARSLKLGLPADGERPDHWWSFAVTSR